MYQLSRFATDPARKMDLQSDLDCGIRSLSRVRRACPKAKIVFLKGNHEARLTKHLWGTESPYVSLRGLTIPALLEFAKYRIEYAESGTARIGGLLCKHGSLVRTRSGYSASAELERLWVSGVSGHTHRLGQVFRTNAQGSFTWIESGCLCKLDPEYLEGQVADWQHGLTYCEIKNGGKRFATQLLPIVNGKLVFGQREISG